MLLQHGQLYVGLLREGPSLGILEEEVEQVRAVEVGPLVHRLRDHVNVRQTLKYIVKIVLNFKTLQRYSSSLSQGFQDVDLGNSPGLWATSVASYCPSRPSQLLATPVTK